MIDRPQPNEETEELFKPQRSSAEVNGYIEAHPEFDPDTALAFLIGSFPQETEGKITWLLEGGAAVRLLTDSSRPTRDLDIITRDTELAMQFANSGQFDAKEISSWLEARGIAYSDLTAERILTNHIVVNIGGRRLLMLHPTLLAASKVLPYWQRQPRSEDIADVERLGLEQSVVLDAVDELRKS